MASEPTDLIRAVDAALDGITPGPWQHDVHTEDGERAHYVWSVGDDMHLAVFTGNYAGAGADGEFIAAAPDLVRRLRDALATAQDDNRTLADAYQSEHDRSLRLAIRAAGADEVLAQRDELRAALAEANATISRVRALHRPMTIDELRAENLHDFDSACADCATYYSPVEWPCPTITAIEGE